MTIENLDERIRGLSDAQRRLFRQGLARIANQGGAHLVAYIKANSDTTIDTARLRESLAGQLPDYMVPSRFVQVETLPRLANGKIDRKRLPQSIPIEHPPATTEDLRPQVDANGVNELKSKLAELWSRNLQVDYVLPDDDFFELGGHSLLGVQLLLDVKEEFGIEIPLADLFEASRLEDMAARIRVPQSGPRTVATIQRGKDQTPVFAVHGGDKTLASAFGPDRPLYLVFDSISTSDADMSTVESIAEYYLDGIREIQPEGPYFLCGYSFGGMVAYEIADQLTSLGESVALVALIDSTPPHIGRWGLQMRVYNLLRRLGDHEGLLKKARFLLRTVVGGLWRRLRARSATAVTDPHGHEEIRQANTARYFEIGFQYRYPESDFNCLVYMPELHPMWVNHLRRKWRRVARGKLKIECVTGATEHSDMTVPPHSDNIAQSVADHVTALESAKLAVRNP